MGEKRTIRGLAPAAVLFAVFVAAAMLAPPGAAALEAGFEVEAAAGAGFGRAAYDLNVPIGADAVMSRLEFPLDRVSVSLGGAFSLGSGGVELWRFALGGTLGLTDPNGLMRDYDWIKPAGFPPVPFSYTESPVQEVAGGASLRASRVLLSRGLLGLWVTAGYRFDYLFQSVRGYEGWQYVWNEVAGAYDLYLIWGSEEALRYTLQVHGLPLGLDLRLSPGGRLGMALEVAYMPVYASDVDDHVLRNKLSTAAGLGHGVLGALELRFAMLPVAGAPARGLYLAARVEGLAWLVSTTQTQEWYGDDPAGPGDETGMVISGIDHDISNLELRARVGVGFSF